MKLFSRLIAVLFTAAGLAPSVQAAGIHFELQGLVPAFGGSVDVAGYGSQGLYLGDSWGNKNHAYTNWTWDTVGMDIASNGDAVISGSMTRGDGSSWGVNILLENAQFVGAALSGVTRTYDGIVGDMLGASNGTGIEWGSLSLTLTAPYSTSVPLGAWQGFAMPEMGHENPAELHVVAGRLRFGAWYRQAPAFAPGDAGYGYDTGASKAVVVERPIPEPGAALVFGLGLLLTGAAVRRR